MIYQNPWKKEAVPSVAPAKVKTLPNWRVNDWFPELSADQKAALRLYFDELLRFNPKINLVSEKSIEDCDLDHFADAIVAWKTMLPRVSDTKKIYDFGSGNGFPGIVFAILAPEKELVLVERDERKCQFLKYVITTLKLKNASVLQKQVEDLPAASVECAVSRGFAPLGKGLMSTRKCLASKGRYFHLKGKAWVSEWVNVPPQLCALWKAEPVGEYSLPAGEPGMTLVVVLTTKAE